MGNLVTDSFQAATWERAKSMLQSEMEWLDQCWETENFPHSTSTPRKMLGEFNIL